MAEMSSPNEKSVTPQDDCNSGWWGSWITSAKSKSAEVYSMVKKDLDEIGTAVKSEASFVLNSTSSAIGKTLKLDEPESTANVMKKSLSSFIGQVSSALSPIPYNDDEDTEVVFSSGDTTMLSTYKRELEALQRVDATFIVPASGPEFESWRSCRDESQVISPQRALRKMADSPLLDSQYQRLVPDAVSHDHFWERYLFRLDILHDRLAAAARKQPQTEECSDPVIANIPLHTDSVIQQSPKKVLPDTTSDTEDFDTDVWKFAEETVNDVELTEEQQILLLEEYEKEISTKKPPKPANDIDNNNTNETTTTKRDKKNNKKIKDGGSPSKSKMDDRDECGNNIVEDYFGKDDASANSDESWEKEFDIEDVKKD